MHKSRINIQQVWTHEMIGVECFHDMLSAWLEHSYSDHYKCGWHLCVEYTVLSILAVRPVKNMSMAVLNTQMSPTHERETNITECKIFDKC